MKPREMYSGAAPAAMGMMGQGLAEVGANIGRTIQSGYQSMGEGLSKGIQSATSSIAGAYADYKNMDSDVKAKQAAAKTLLPYLPKSAQESFANAEAAIAADTSLGLRDKKAFYDLHMNMLGNAVGHSMSMEKVAAETTGRIQAAGVNAAAELALQEKRKQDDIDKEKRLRDYEIEKLKGKEPTRKGLHSILGIGQQSSEAPAAAPVFGGGGGGLPTQGGGFSDALFGGSNTGQSTATGPTVMTVTAPSEGQQALQENDLSLAWFKQNNPDFYNRIVNSPGFDNWDERSYQNRRDLIEQGALLTDQERGKKEKPTSAGKSLLKSYRPASQTK